jgi:hypothetical protein
LIRVLRGKKIRVYSCEFVVFARSKNFEKSEKKSLPGLVASIKREFDATNRPWKPFKKTLKKVKKKLACALKI